MSYAEKIGIYQGDCKILLGRHKMFSNYIEEFSKTVKSGEKGLDLGTGPSGCNSVFFTHTELHGCDIEKEVVYSLPETYAKTYTYVLGRDTLPYENGELDFLFCSCVIQHLNSLDELKAGINEIHRVLKPGGSFYLMFKVGTHDTNFTHHNEYYDEERTFRVFSLPGVLGISSGFDLLSSEYLLDENHIPYCCTIFKK